jgi:hypothetical protein
MAMRSGALPMPGRAAAAAAARAEHWESGAIVLLVLLMFSFGVIQLYSASSYMAQA